MQGTKLLGLLAIFVSFSAFGQDSTVVSDFEVWGGISVEKSFLEKKLQFELEQQFRFDENSTHLDQYFTELAVNYEVYKNLRLGVGYRFIRNNKNSGYHNEQRIFADLSYKYKMERFSLAYRFRFQNHDEIGISREEGDDITRKFRLRVKAAYNIPNWKLDPYLSVEGFFTQKTLGINYIESITETINYSGFEKIRFTLGTKYKINKFMDVGGFYRIERELNGYDGTFGSPATYYIGGLNLTFNL